MPEEGNRGGDGDHTDRHANADASLGTRAERVALRRGVAGSVSSLFWGGGEGPAG